MPPLSEGEIASLRPGPRAPTEVTRAERAVPGAHNRAVVSVTKLKDLTGPGHTDRFGVGGTDLGVVAPAPDGRLVVVFGDAFENAGVGGPGWRSPVVLFADPASVRSGLEWTGCAGRSPGYADQILDYVHGQRVGPRSALAALLSRGGQKITTKLPTDVITLGDTMYLQVMACEGLGNVHWTEIHRSADGGVTWTPTGTWWPGDEHHHLFQMLTWELADDGYVYAFTTGFRRDAGLLLHRVPAERLLDPAAWEGWGWAGRDDGADGTWAWGRPPTLVLPGAFGELCLRRVDGRWWLAAFDAGRYRIDLIALPDGPTTNLHAAERVTAITGSGWHDEDHSRGRVAQPYGGYIVPGSTNEEMHLVVSQWNTGTNWPYRSLHFRVDL